MHPTWMSNDIASRSSGPLCFVGPSSLNLSSLSLSSSLRTHPPEVNLAWSQAPLALKLSDPSVILRRSLPSLSSIWIMCKVRMILPTFQGVAKVRRAPGSENALQAGHLVSTQWVMAITIPSPLSSLPSSAQWDPGIQVEIQVWAQTQNSHLARECLICIRPGMVCTSFCL